MAQLMKSSTRSSCRQQTVLKAKLMLDVCFISYFDINKYILHICWQMLKPKPPAWYCTFKGSKDIPLRAAVIVKKSDNTIFIFFQPSFVFPEAQDMSPCIHGVARHTPFKM